MLRLIGLIVVGMSLPAVADPRAGKVVRVERERTIPLITPVLCVQIKPDGSGLCIGPQPKIGESVILVDETQVIAEVKVDGTSKGQPNCDAVWQITGTVIRGDVSKGNHKSIGLIDANTSNTAARVVPKNKLPKLAKDARVELGIDRDGDGTADVLASNAGCAGGGECIEFWSRRAGGLERVWSTNLQSCR
jgi:hypothetical protein